MSTLPAMSPSCANLVIQPLKSVPAIKEQLRDELATLARQKVALERSWHEREQQRVRLQNAVTETRQEVGKLDADQGNSKRQSFQLSRHEALAKLRAVEEAETSFDASPSKLKKRKGRGMGQRLKGMIQSASFSANLSLKAGNAPAPKSHQANPAPRKSIQLESPIPVSSPPSRPHTDKRHSFTASSSSRPNSYCSPFLPSPILPSEEQSLASIHQVALPSQTQPTISVDTSGNRHASGPVYRDLQSQTGMQVIEDEIHRESAGRKREGMLWTSGIWEDIAASGGKGGDRKERGKWERQSCLHPEGIER